MLGMAIVSADVYQVTRGGNPHVVLYIVGVLFAFAGGYVLTPTLADAFADRVKGFLPFVKGGDRFYDPPADEDKKDPAVRPPEGLG